MKFLLGALLTAELSLAQRTTEPNLLTACPELAAQCTTGSSAGPVFACILQTNPDTLASGVCQDTLRAYLASPPHTRQWDESKQPDPADIPSQAPNSHRWHRANSTRENATRREAQWSHSNSDGSGNRGSWNHTASAGGTHPEQGAHTGARGDRTHGSAGVDRNSTHVRRQASWNATRGNRPNGDHEEHGFPPRGPPPPVGDHNATGQWPPVPPAHGFPPRGPPPAVGDHNATGQWPAHGFPPRGPPPFGDHNSSHEESRWNANSTRREANWNASHVWGRPEWNGTHQWNGTQWSGNHSATRGPWQHDSAEPRGPPHGPSHGEAFPPRGPPREWNDTDGNHNATGPWQHEGTEHGEPRGPPHGEEPHGPQGGPHGPFPSHGSENSTRREASWNASHVWGRPQWNGTHDSWSGNHNATRYGKHGTESDGRGKGGRTFENLARRVRGASNTTEGGKGAPSGKRRPGSRQGKFGPPPDASSSEADNNQS